ncbi:hypothetical protein ONS95_008586 [Cadophora gregata]|uniref:uncharacterized protein n=1 Tax=Cadophora gregata TaxID=51156 RepID=UPI0026DB9EA1|nr:uncharacterized protein ONS95_008586 [Cadophora gregata]KAK0099835.1 hypothetical protein ONS95_008586 [Cadophora gregata]KAK0123600.1 hypothetical protein ONS96_010575 [Cadophora gregata f. sp. sojae]
MPDEEFDQFKSYQEAWEHFEAGQDIPFDYYEDTLERAREEDPDLEEEIIPEIDLIRASQEDEEGRDWEGIAAAGPNNDISVREDLDDLRERVFDKAKD